MRRLVPLALAAALAAPTTAPAQAADPIRDDLACMIIVTMFASRTEDAAARQGATTGFGYYMGRLKGRDPGIDLKDRLIAEARALIADPNRLRAEATRCGADMQAWGQETQEIGEALEAEGRRLRDRPGP